MSLKMFEPDFPHTVTAHEPAFVNVRVYTVDPAFCRILPHCVVAVVGKFGLFVRILGYHQLVVVDFAFEMFVVKIRVSRRDIDNES